MSSTDISIDRLQDRGPSNRPRRNQGFLERHAQRGVNVSEDERSVSLLAGSLLTLFGLSRRSLPGLLVAGVGGSLLYRGASGHCDLYQSLGVDTSGKNLSPTAIAEKGVHILESFLINKPPEDLYREWRNFENLPRLMTYLESVRVIDDRRSHWVAKAPSVIGGKVEWDAEITHDEQNRSIGWRSLPGSGINHTGSISFTPTKNNRGTRVEVALNYIPPAGQVGRVIAKLFGKEPQQEIREDLRRFKRTMETGEVPTTIGQPRGTCDGRGQREQRGMLSR